jgi:hypothetical protein
MSAVMAKKPKNTAKAGDDSEGKKPNRTGKPINVWLPDELHAAVEQFRSDQRVRPAMTDVVELAIQEFLIREGYWKEEE